MAGIAFLWARLAAPEVTGRNMSLAFRRSLHTPTCTPATFRCSDGTTFQTDAGGTVEHVDDAHYAEVLASGKFQAVNPHVLIADATTCQYGRG